MASEDQVVFVLQLVLALGPLAVYFLGLGLVNSRAHPCVVRARVDFVVLAVAFVPVVIPPVVALIAHGWLWLAGAAVVMVLGLFFGMLPRRDAGWVIYNVDRAQCRGLVERACRRLGWTVVAAETELRIAPVDLVVSLSPVPWLRTVTVRIRAGSGGGGGSVSDRLIQAVCWETRHETMLPSPTGASMVVIGAALLGVPMWYLFHHMDAIVEVVRRILFT